MSYHSIFGAYAIPLEVADPFSDLDAVSPYVFSAGSRNGWFQYTFKAILDKIAEHEALRFLAAQTWTHQSDDTEPVSFTVLDQVTLCEALSQLEYLLNLCKNDVELLTEQVFGYQGWTVSHVQAALSSALSGLELTEHVTDGGENDSPEFFFSVLCNLRILLRIAQEQQLNIVYYNWLPE